MHRLGHDWGLVCELLKWSLTNTSMTWLPCLYPELSLCHHVYPLHVTAEADLLNFAANFSFELCKFGHDWAQLLQRAKYSSLVLILGAGGILVYRWCSRSNGGAPGQGDTFACSEHGPSPGRNPLLKWLFEEELVEDISEENIFFAEGRYFGPTLQQDLSYSSNDADVENDSSDDLSLNSFSSDSSPRMFLRRPIIPPPHSAQKGMKTPLNITNPCPKCVKGTCRLKKHQASRFPSNSSSCYSGSPKLQMKTSTPETCDNMILQRITAPSFSPQEWTERLRLENVTDSANNNTEVDFSNGQYQNRYGSLYRYQTRADRWAVGADNNQTFSPVRDNSPQRLCREDSLDSVSTSFVGESRSGSMQDLVQNAREVRRLIKDASIDSQASDYSLDFSLNGNLGASTAEGMNQICQDLDKLVDNCDFIEEEINAIPGDSNLLSSKSTASGLSHYAMDNSKTDSPNLVRENSIPDIRKLHRTLRKSRSVWKLTGFSEMREDSLVSEGSEWEWDSPLHGWQGVPGQCLARVPDLGSSRSDSEVQEDIDEATCSSADPWEWDDDECQGVGDWNVPSLDKRFSSKIMDLSPCDRLSPPPRSFTMSYENRITLTTTPECSSLVPKQLKSLPQSNQMLGMESRDLIALKLRDSSCCSDSSGFHGSESGSVSTVGSVGMMDISASSSVFTSSINLSPVREGREPLVDCLRQ